ncbi:uncharacterized protein LOC126561351 [Anopheles maculipalpis]|uniref:uncharacterized protein LOC126561351 n=1 Tax=Anopheles maculipalpis TaxID=1496333 RepID=UPI0021597A66|nr:uncharacterized protein LOC126561351 [Anopheles maculipalpis]
MSGEDFIYSAITNDNMNAFDLNVIASTLASTDKLVRQHKQQKEENDLLREKISSLHESALQIKTLYETESAKVAQAEAQLASYVSQCKQLEERCLEADSNKINADLILMERLAENDRQHEEKERRYQSLITDLIRYFSTSGPESVECGKKRDLKHHLPSLDVLNLPDDVKAFLQQAAFHRSKRRKERTKSAVLKDQECQTVRVEMRTSSNNTDPFLAPCRPEVRDCGTDAPEAPKEQPVSKTFCDKATMHSMSTITRATCTSVFIKRVDVGVNFPEVTLKSVDEILRECVPLPPLLLTPITDILPLYESVGTQTDQPEPSVEKPSLVTCGTMTVLKNIRKRIDYRMVEQQYASSMAEQLFGKIKQEDFAAPGFEFEPHDTFGSMHPHLSTIWRLLGESIFMLMSSGRRFDNQCYNMLNEQLTTIRDMLEADGRRESELMSTMFSNVRATVVAAAGYGKDRGTTAPVAPPHVVLPVSSSTATELDSGEPAASVTDACDCGGGVMDLEKEIETVRAVSATKEISNNEESAVVVVLVEPESHFPERQITPNVSSGSKVEAVAQSIETNGTEVVSKTSNDEKQQTSEISPLTSPSTSADVEHCLILDNEVDRIEQQMQMMEEGEKQLSTLVGSRNQMLETDDSPQSEENELSVTGVSEPEPAANEQLPPPPIVAVPRPSTPPQVLCVSSCYPPASTTATFVSPIKVKETNQLVKDQFKTPTQPPIGKRKQRARRADEPPQLPHASKRIRFDGQSNNGGSLSGGRPTSPTTEFLLEDDWDEKFSSIMAHMAGPLKESGERRPLSPITDRCEEYVVELMEQEKDKDDRVVEKQETLPMDQESNEEENIRPVENVTRIEEAKDSTTVEVQDGKICVDESKSTQDLADIAPIERRSPEESKDEHITSERNLPRERRLSEEEERTLSTAVDSVIENSDTSVSMDTSDKDECSNYIDPPTALEDGEISEELNESFRSTGELVIDIEPPLPDDDSKPSTIVWDSPMSPPAHETGSLSVSVEAPSHPIPCATDSPLSPPLPSDRGSPAPATEPPRIPLFHVALHSQLRQQAQERKEPIYAFIALHKAKNGQESSHRHTGRFNAQEQQLLQQLTDILTMYLQRPDWRETVVNETITAVLNCTQDVYLMSIALLELVVSCGDITVNVLCSPPAPPLPLVQQKLILIVRHLGYGLDALEQVLMRELDRRMFQLKGDSVPLTGLIALTFLYIGLEDSKPSETPWKREYNVRLYMFKCLYYFGFKGLPLVYYVLRAFPFALPKKGSAHYDNSDAMIATLRTILMNVNYSENKVGSSEAGLYRKRELLWLLRNTYGYQQGSPTYEELVVNLVEKIRANKLRNVAHSLILVAKRNGFDWARLHIIQKRIYPLLNDYLKQFELLRAASPSDPVASTTVANLDERIVTCIFTIASIMKTQPSNEDASRVMQIFTTIVQLSEGNRAIQEEAIAGLIKFSRFGFVDIFQRLSSWNPDYPISDRIKLMLMTMVHRKPPLFWKQLLQNRIV